MKDARRTFSVEIYARIYSASMIVAFLGVPPVALGSESVAGVADGVRSGLSSVVSSVVFLLSSIVWVLPALLATNYSYTITFNMYGHYGTVMQLLSRCSFSIADAVMAIAGISMVVRSLAIDW